MHNGSLDTNLEQHSNINILSSSNISNYNIKSNSNFKLDDSFKVTEKLFHSYTKSKNGIHLRVGDEQTFSDNTTNSQAGNGNDYINEYESDDIENSEDKELMQLNPSTDFYDDVDDHLYEDESELLPESEELVQSSINDGVTEEEEDMGYDEDDERIAITVERPKEMPSRINIKNDKDVANIEGSGSLGKSSLKVNPNDRLRFDYINSYRRKQHKQFADSYVGVVASEVDLRESSGNFANDDEDNDDDNDEDNDSEGFFNSKRKSNSRYFRKNTNDAIKIISTPLGKVGIVYQQTSSSLAEDKVSKNVDKKSTSLTDFDALSPDPESSHRLASSHPKITPVLTADGKVALLYRGDSENSKYEPIRNLTTHKFNKSIEPSADKKTSGSSSNTDGNSSEYDDSESVADFEDDIDPKFGSNRDLGNVNKNAAGIKLTTKGEQAAILPAPEVAPTTGSFIIRPTDSVLPMINRPLSEVLGIKKNQFKQFRIKDTSTTESPSRSLAGANIDYSDTTTLHFLTKVNLADYPTSSRTRNFDFDFSRDSTMLDERSRNKEQQGKSQLNTNLQGHLNLDESNDVVDITNEEILSKTEVVNLAIIPHFDEELERLQRLREYEDRRHHRQRHRQKQNDEDLSGIHCIMQAMMGIAAISTVFGMLGTFFKQRILDQLRLMHW